MQLGFFYLNGHLNMLRVFKLLFLYSIFIQLEVTQTIYKRKKNISTRLIIMSASRLYCRGLNWRGFKRYDWKHMKAPLAAAIRSTHDLRAQHHSQLALAVRRFWGGKKAEVPGEKPLESGWDWPITHPTYAPGRNQTQVIAVGGTNANYCATLTCILTIVIVFMLLMHLFVPICY